MLLGDFYTVSALETEGTSIHATLELNPCHRIFQGHFAGQPVVPGVCMMQLIKELVEASFNRSFRLTKADHLKFLAVIDPRKDPVIKAVISYTVSPPQEINATTSPSQINATAPPSPEINVAAFSSQEIHVASPSPEINVAASLLNETTTFFKLKAVLASY